MDLFEHARRARLETESPLAHRMRPRTLDEFVGQDPIIGPGRLLRRAVEADQLSSIIVHGPPGTGKTTLASIIAHHTKSHFISLNAVLAGVKEIRQAIDEALERRRLEDRRTVLFVDEVHRWNKAQQDALLPHVENGTLILIGATTENPYFEVNKALVSRSRIFRLRPLSGEDLRRIAHQALANEERGYGRMAVEVSPEALDHLVDVSNGDARGVLNALELAVETTPPGPDGVIRVDLGVAEESIQRRAVLYDKEGDVHYDTISAFIKSLRGSDPDAALYWMARMVYAGEDPRFIFRRMGILAAEDVGLADPRAAQIVTTCWELYERIGMPEGRFHLAEAALYLATCPKSNSTMAFFDALAAVERESESDVPVPLKDASRDGEGFGHGKGYLYPHAYRDHWVAQQYLPDALQGRVFYEPGDQGHEGAIREEVARRREVQLATMLEGLGDRPVEVLTTSPRDRRREDWFDRTIAGSAGRLEAIRDGLVRRAAIQRHHVVLVLHERTGLFTWEAVRQAPEGGVFVLAADETARAMLDDRARGLAQLDRPRIYTGSLPGTGVPRFDRILVHDAHTRHQDTGELVALASRHLAPGGRILIGQVVPRRGQRPSGLLDWSGADEDCRRRVVAAEEALFCDPSDPMTRWDVEDLAGALRQVGLEPEVETEVLATSRVITRQQLEDWLSRGRTDRDRPSYIERLAAAGLPDGDLERLETLLRTRLRNRTVDWKTTIGWYSVPWHGS